MSDELCPDTQEAYARMDKETNQQRMAQVIGEILNVWSKYPELRLGQLLQSAANRNATSVSLFSISDEELLNRVKMLDKELSEHNPGRCCK